MAAMRIGRTVEAKGSASGKVTLGDLRAFIAEMDQAGAADTTPVKATVTFGGALKSLKATAVRFGDDVKGASRGEA
jgi:hypothetical protein